MTCSFSRAFLSKMTHTQDVFLSEPSFSFLVYLSYLLLDLVSCLLLYWVSDNIYLTHCTLPSDDPHILSENRVVLMRSMLISKHCSSRNISLAWYQLTVLVSQVLVMSFVYLKCCSKLVIIQPKQLSYYLYFFSFSFHLIK